MITLPDNWQDLLMVKTNPRALCLHLKNDNDQYFTYYMPIDPALPLDDIIAKIPQDNFGTQQAYVLREDLSTEWQAPRDQNWKPAPLGDPSMVSLAQYRKELSMTLDNQEEAPHA